MFGEEIGAGILATIKGIGDTAVKVIDQFSASPEEKMSFKLEMQKVIYEANKTVMDFTFKMVNSAQNREIQTGDKTTKQLAWIYTGGYFGIFMLLISGVFTVEDGIKQLVDVLMAVLTAGQYSILTYYFGSSHGSAGKDKVLDRIVNHKETK